MSYRRPEDVTGWIAYADFLTTQAALFFLLARVFAARLPAVDPWYVRGKIEGPTSGGMPECLVSVGQHRRVLVPQSGAFEMRFDSVAGHLGMMFQADCSGYRPYEELVQVRARDTVQLTI